MVSSRRRSPGLAIERRQQVRLRNPQQVGERETGVRPTPAGDRPEADEVAAAVGRAGDHVQRSAGVHELPDAVRVAR